MKSFSVTDARNSLPALIDMCEKEKVVIERHGKAVAILVAPSKFEEMLEALEDAHDLKLIEAARAEGGPSIPWEQVKKDLGW